MISADPHGIDGILKILKSLPDDLGGTVRVHRERLKITQERLAEDALVSTNTIQRVESGESETPDIETIIAICVALSLDYELAMDVVVKSGYSGMFLRKTRKTIAYSKILTRASKITVRKANTYLIQNGLKPLKKDRAA